MAQDAVHFDIWGCRGSRSFLPARSSIGNNTSCYSLRAGDRLFVFDAGWGLPALGWAMESQKRFSGVRRVDLFVSHAHCDHWEGLKDVGWLWERGNGIELTIRASHQALSSIRSGFDHPSYVPLEVLAMGTLGALRMESLGVGERRDIGDGATVQTFPLNHASGDEGFRKTLDTLGFRVTVPRGPTVCYLLDHEPNEGTQSVEREMTDGAHLVVYDAHFSRIRDQKFGHGSQEHTANVARRSPETMVLAGHHGPMYSDADLVRNFRSHARGLANFKLAIEGHSYPWVARRGAFAMDAVAPVKTQVVKAAARLSAAVRSKADGAARARVTQALRGRVRAAGQRAAGLMRGKARP